MLSRQRTCMFGCGDRLEILLRLVFHEIIFQNRGQDKNAANGRHPLLRLFDQSLRFRRGSHISFGNFHIDTALSHQSHVSRLKAGADSSSGCNDEMLGASFDEPGGEFQAETTQTTDQQIRLVRMAGKFPNCRQSQRMGGFVSDLDQNLANVFSRGHEAECLFHFAPTKYGAIQGAHGAGLDAGGNELMDDGPIWITFFEQGIQENAVERYVLQENSHAEGCVVGEIELAYF